MALQKLYLVWLVAALILVLAASTVEMLHRQDARLGSAVAFQIVPLNAPVTAGQDSAGRIALVSGSPGINVARLSG